jgi:ABC-2 type transport system permease protein
MLYLKAWRESRARFLLSLIFLCGLSSAVVFYFAFTHRHGRFQNHQPLDYAHYIWAIIFKGGNSVREMFVLIVLFLGMGGLLRERAHGSAAFSLALPIPRWRFVAARGLVGVLEVGALALVPAATIVALSPAIGQPFPAAQAIQFAILWSACGAAFFAGAFLCSALVEGEYASPVTAVIALAIYSVTVNMSVFEEYPLNTLNIHSVMSGEAMPYFRPDIAQITALPWGTLICILAIAAGFLALSAHLTQRQDF